MKKSWLAAMLAGSLALPYLSSAESGVRDQVGAWLSGVSGTSADTAATPATAAVSPPAQTPPAWGATAARPASWGGSTQGAGSAALPPVVPVDRLPPRRIEEVFRFEVTPPWVLSSWPRVSTVLADLNLQGYRVALVTGPAEYDLAGALTYYFDAEQRLQRMQFVGTTGDARPLVEHLTSRLGFERKVTDDPRLYRYEVLESGQVLSLLEIRPKPVIHAYEPRHRFDVMLLIRRPASLR